MLISANSEETLAAGDRVATCQDFKRFFTVNGRLMQSHRISQGLISPFSKSLSREQLTYQEFASLFTQRRKTTVLAQPKTLVNKHRTDKIS